MLTIINDELNNQTNHRIMMDKHFQIAKKDSKINWLCDVDQKGED
jgi:ribosomal protein L15E